MRNAQKRLDKKYGDAEGTTYLCADFSEDILAEPAENTSKGKRRGVQNNISARKRKKSQKYGD